MFGYFPEPTKSFLVIDDKQFSRATEAFSGLGINVVCSQRLLGGVIGNTVGRIAIVETLIKQWVSELECLTMIPSMHPQAAFAAFTKSLQFRWAYVQRVIPNCQSLFKTFEVDAHLNLMQKIQTESTEFKEKLYCEKI